MSALFNNGIVIAASGIANTVVLVEGEVVTLCSQDLGVASTSLRAGRAHSQSAWHIVRNPSGAIPRQHVVEDLDAIPVGRLETSTLGPRCGFSCA